MTIENLPGVYISIYDLSTLPEGQTSLTCGAVLRADRGPIGVNLVTSPTDFLSKYTFSGKTSIKDDPTYHSILKVLSKTNKFYVSRAENGALYGGSVVKREYLLGNIKAVDEANNTIILAGDITTDVQVNNTLRLFNATNNINVRYEVVEVTSDGTDTTIKLSAELTEDVEANNVIVFKTSQPVKLTDIKVGNLSAVDVAAKTITINEERTNSVFVGDRIQVTGATSKDTDGYYTVTELTREGNTLTIVVAEEIKATSTIGKVYQNAIATPEGYNLAEDELFLITTPNPGDYADKIGYDIVSYTESPEQLEAADTFQITAYDLDTGVQLEVPYTCSRKENAKALDGTSLYIEYAINGNSDYIYIYNNEDIADTEIPCDTVAQEKLSGGYNGETLTPSDYIKALSLFEDKTIPISILMNGECEDVLYQQSIIAISENRKDMVGFLNSRLADEKATSNSTKATNIVDYKKKTLGSTSWMSTMYANHVNYPDIFNSRTVKIGADAVAVSGWLDVINTLGYPYAYAGVRNGLVTGVTTDWKIGDASAEAQMLNNASINYVAYDPIQGRYYMQSQKTLQTAKSALRNLGTVFNIMNVKEAFADFYKEYLELPITSDLKIEMLNKGREYMDLAIDQNRFRGYTFKNITTQFDEDNDTLRFVLSILPVGYATYIYVTMNIVNSTMFFEVSETA